MPPELPFRRSSANGSGGWRAVIRQNGKVAQNGRALARSQRQLVAEPNSLAEREATPPEPIFWGINGRGCPEIVEGKGVDDVLYFAVE